MGKYKNQKWVLVAVILVVLLVVELVIMFTMPQNETSHETSEPTAAETTEAEINEATAPSESADNTTTAETAEPVDTTMAAETTQTEETTAPVETTVPLETTQPPETTEPMVTTEPVETTEPEETTQPEETTEVSEPVEPTENLPASITFPKQVEGGKLEIESVFQFDGINPDCGYQEGENIASIVLKNTSGSYLTEANVTLTLTDGAKVHFYVSDLPADGRAMAFSTENTSIEADVGCAEVSCDAVFDVTAVSQSDKVAIVVDGMDITLTNQTGDSISEIVIYCRSPLGEEYFGGAAYQYTINDLPAFGTTTVTAVDCILGLAEVVRIVIK